MTSLLDFNKREDHIGKYFKDHLEKFLFGELSKTYLKKTEGMEFMEEIPVPLEREDLEIFKDGNDIHLAKIIENMAWVVGIDTNFIYNQDYIKFLGKFPEEMIIDTFSQNIGDAIEAGDLDKALIFTRAILTLIPDNLEGMFNYALICREFYGKADENQEAADFKKESMEYFEHLSMLYPDFPQAYYYLGYDYLNLGLYQKAELAWREFLEKATDEDDIEEIEERLQQLKEPMKIEEGYTAVLAGRWEEGLDILEPFLSTSYKEWWPLHYYLGLVYARLGRNRDAISSFKRVLQYNGSHVETMEELVELYAYNNDKENEEKYKNKIDIILGE